MNRQKRVGKPKGVTDKDVIVAQKKAEKEAAFQDENHPLKRYYSENTKVEISGILLRNLIDAILTIQDENTIKVYSTDGSGKVVGFGAKNNPEPINNVLEALLTVHLREIEAGNTVDMETIRKEVMAKQSQAAPKLEVVKD